jgi:hypothetical protein
MMSNTFRRIACLGAILGLGVASSPRVHAAPAPQAASASVTVAHASPATAGASAQTQAESGRGWGSMIGCAACIVAAGLVVAGGPVSIIIAVNAPGSAIAVMGCAATCYEAFQ